MKDTLPMHVKAEISRIVLDAALVQFNGKSVILWTGGKDSTLLLYLALERASVTRFPFPRVMVVDHGQHFPETWEFMKKVQEQYKFRVIVTRSKRAIDKGYSLDTEEGNHQLKTVVLHSSIEAHGFKGVITGIRWDENSARADEVFFSPRKTHTRVHPILPWTESDVWKYTLRNRLPIHPLYKRGYRSFDGTEDSLPTSHLPAWQQDLDASPERQGRAQDKEGIMRRLRDLGYF